MPHYQSQGLDLAYRALGRGPALVLIHGWGANGQEWDGAGWVAALRDGRRLLIPDVRGHGASARPHDPAQYDLRALAADVIALLDAEGVSEADLFGYSMGAAVALWITAAVPLRVRSLIVGGVPGGAVEETIALGRALRGQEPLTERARVYADYAREQGETDLEALGACLESGLAVPDGNDLLAFGGEALLVAGDQDRRRTMTESLLAFLPGGRFLLLDHADHMGAYADPRFQEATVAFLDEVSPR
jgi:pimeloyl-ACP methyl ester carboxylesterase